MIDQLTALAKTLAKTSAMAVTMTTFGIYEGAAIIAFIAALSRSAYTHEKLTVRLFGRFFTMSLSITMLIVHIGLLNDWGEDQVIIVSGVTAFLCREVLESIMSSKDLIIKRIVRAFK